MIWSKGDYIPDIPEEFQDCFSFVSIVRSDVGWRYEMIIDCYAYVFEAKDDLAFFAGVLQDVELYALIGQDMFDLQERLAMERYEMAKSIEELEMYSKIFKHKLIQVSEDEDIEEVAQMYDEVDDVWSALSGDLNYYPSSPVEEEIFEVKEDEPENWIKGLAEEILNPWSQPYAQYVQYNEEGTLELVHEVEENYSMDETKIRSLEYDGTRLSLRLFVSVLADYYTLKGKVITWKVCQILYLFLARINYNGRAECLLVKGPDKIIGFPREGVDIYEIFNDWIFYCYLMFQKDSCYEYDDSEWKYLANISRMLELYYTEGWICSCFVWYENIGKEYIFSTIELNVVSTRLRDADKVLLGMYEEVFEEFVLYELINSSAVSYLLCSGAFGNAIEDDLFISSEIFRDLRRRERLERKGFSSSDVIELLGRVWRNYKDVSDWTIRILRGDYQRVTFLEC